MTRETMFMKTNKGTVMDAEKFTPRYSVDSGGSIFQGAKGIMQI